MLQENTTLYPEIDTWFVVDLIFNLYVLNQKDHRIKFLISIANYGFVHGYLTENQKKHVYEIYISYSNQLVEEIKGVDNDIQN